MHARTTVQARPTIDFLLSKADREYEKVKNFPCVRAAHARFPIVWFGDLEAYFRSEIRVVTVGRNPSFREFSEPRFFYEENGKLYPVTERDWHGSERKHVYEAFNHYFEYNPYDWFKNFERILKCHDFCVSYGGKIGSTTKNAAIHIDFSTPVATNPTFSKLDSLTKEKLQSDLFSDLIASLKPDLVLFSNCRKEVLSQFGLKEPFFAYGEPSAGTGKRVDYVEAYEKDGVCFVWGKNFNGAPWASVSDERCAKIFPELNALLKERLKPRTPQEGCFWVVPAIPEQYWDSWMGLNFDIFDFTHLLRDRGTYLVSVFDDERRHHSELWREVQRKYPVFSAYDYEFFRRGRIWTENGKTVIFMDGDIRNKRIVNEVKFSFGRKHAEEAHSEREQPLPPKPAFEVREGDEVIHRIYGAGVVLKIDENDTVWVRFPKYGKLCLFPRQTLQDYFDKPASKK